MKTFLIVVLCALASLAAFAMHSDASAWHSDMSSSKVFPHSLTAERDFAIGGIMPDHGVFGSSERRESLAGPLSKNLDSLTSADLEEYLCSNLTSETNGLELFYGAYSTVTPLELPECFYASASGLLTLSLDSLIVRGNTTIPNPFERLWRAISPQAPYVKVIRSSMLTPTGDPAALDWDVMFGSFSALSTIIFTGTDLSLSFLPQLIPPTLNSIQLQNCKLAGTIPENLFQPAALSTITSLNLQLHDNMLNGTIPLGLMDATFSALTKMEVWLNNNQLVGPLSNLFERSIWDVTKFTSLTLHATGNPGLNGTIPRWFSSGICSMTIYIMNLRSCSLTGTIPNTLLSDIDCGSQPLSVSLDFSNNQLEGPISPAMWNLNASATRIFNPLNITLSNNRLNGSMPSTLFDTLSLALTTSATLDFSGNLFTGALPSRLPPIDPTFTNGLVLDFSRNTLMTGSVPPNFLGSILDQWHSPSTSYTYYKVTLGGSSITGDLQIPDLRLASGIRFILIASNANLTSLSLANTSTPLNELDISNNPFLTSDDLPLLIAGSPRLSALSASRTSLSGTMASNAELSSATDLARIDLSYTAIDFCNEPRSTWTPSYIYACNLESTSAYYCQSQYPSICTFSDPNPPVDPPTSPAPVIIAPSAPVGCSLSTRPSPDFVCIGSTWTFAGTLSVTVLVIPSGATQTIIDGNLTSTSVVINGLGSVLIITGCASNLTTITVELTPADLETIGPGGKLQRLLELRSNGSCNSTLTSVGIDTRVHGNTCRKVSVTKQFDSSSGTQLSGLFRVDKSSCQRWWIILVSVICGVVVIGVVVIIIVWKVVGSRNVEKHKTRLHGSG